MSGWLPPGCTDHDIDVAAGYWDEDENDNNEVENDDNPDEVDENA